MDENFKNLTFSKCCANTLAQYKAIRPEMNPEFNRVGDDLMTIYNVVLNSHMMPGMSAMEQKQGQSCRSCEIIRLLRLHV